MTKKFFSVHRLAHLDIGQQVWIVLSCQACQLPVALKHSCQGSSVALAIADCILEPLHHTVQLHQQPRSLEYMYNEHTF